jgi:hypothetical protein
MRRASLALGGLVAACSSGGAAVGGPTDASSDASPSVEALDATAYDAGDAGRDAMVPVTDAAAATDAADAGPNPCSGATVPPSTLACTGLYADFATKEVAANALAYTPSSPLWSDGAQKQRWIELPPNTQIDISNPDEWTFPVGTKLFKEFRVSGQRVETRMFQKTSATFWVYATYAWNNDASAATINYGGPVPVGDGGATWTIPTNDDCDECHRGRQDRILGFEQVGLGLSGAQGLTLAQLAEMGLVTPAPTTVSLTIGDDGTGLDAPAFGWIHVNCGVTCHNSNPSAAGYGAGMLLRLDPTQLDGSPPNPATWDILKTTLDVPCISGSLAGQPRVQPGDPADSAIYQLIDERGVLQMPPIASLVVDTTDVAIVASWIRAVGADAGTPGADAAGPDAQSGESGAPDATVSDDAGGDDAADADADAGDDDAAEGGSDPLHRRAQR